MTRLLEFKYYEIHCWEFNIINSQNELGGLHGYIDCYAGTHHAEKHILHEMCMGDQHMSKRAQGQSI